jgi:beta-lactamase class A
MVNCLEHVLTRDALSTRSRELLTSWLVSSTTGLQRIRAGLPSGWIAGDKTGTGANGAANDVAIAWPPGRKPLLIAIYMSESSLDMETLSAAHSEIARALVSALAS